MFENNQVSIVGEIVSDFRFSHEVYGEGFYVVDVAVNRLSNYMDYIPLMISERLIDVTADYIGQNIYVMGQFRSFNRHEEKRTGSYCRSSSENWNFWMIFLRISKAIRFFWTVISAKSRFTEKHR